MNSMKNISPNLILRQNALYWTHILVHCVSVSITKIIHLLEVTHIFERSLIILIGVGTFSTRKKGEYATSTSKFQPLISREFDQTHIILMCHQHFLDILRKFQINSSNLLGTCICSAVYSTNRGGMRRSGANHTSNIYNV